MRMSVIHGSLHGEHASKETLDNFLIQLALFYELVNRNTSGLNSVVHLTLRVLRHCLRHINYKELSSTVDFKNKHKEKELFRYLHLIVDLSSNSKNHVIMMHPIIIRNVLMFIMNSESENLMHYHRIFDCNQQLIRPNQYDKKELFPRVFLNRFHNRLPKSLAENEARPLRAFRTDNLPALRTLIHNQLINMKLSVIGSKHDQILQQIEDIPIEFSNRKNTQRILAFLDFCYGDETIRNKVISSDKLTYSLIDCLNNIDYEAVDNFEAMYDIWRICLKYFNIRLLAEQPYFDKLRKVVFAKCCLVHNLSFMKPAVLVDAVNSSGDKAGMAQIIMQQYDVQLEGDVNHLNHQEIEKITGVGMFLRLKLLNLILSFFNLVLDSQRQEDKIKPIIEMNVSSDNYFQGEIEIKDNHLNLSLLMPLIDSLMKNVTMFRLWDFTFTVSESLYLIQKLIDYCGGNPNGSKNVYNYVLKIIDADISQKRENQIDVCEFGQVEMKTKLGIPITYLKNVIRIAEILPTSEAQLDFSVAKLLQIVMQYYDFETNFEILMDESVYQSFLIVLARAEVELMSEATLHIIFTIFNENKDKYPLNINVLFQLVFLKRLIIHCFDEIDIFAVTPVVNYYYSLFDKFEEYLSMLKTEKISEKIKKTENQKAILTQHSIKNSRAIKLIDETIGQLREEIDLVKKTLSIPQSDSFENVFEENITYLKCITVMVYEILILSFKFEKFSKKIDSVNSINKETSD
jgi:hypothetical protein